MQSQSVGKQAGKNGPSPPTYKSRRRLVPMATEASSSGEKPSAFTIQNYREVGVLGRGSFGEVKLAQFRGVEGFFAVKCLSKKKI